MKQGAPKRLDTSKIKMVTRAPVGASKNTCDRVIIKDGSNILNLVKDRIAVQRRMQKKVLAMKNS